MKKLGKLVDAAAETEAKILSRVRAYNGHRTSDGKLFDDEDEALSHERGLFRRELLGAFCEEHCFRDMDAGAFFNLMEEHRHELLNLLA